MKLHRKLAVLLAFLISASSTTLFSGCSEARNDPEAESETTLLSESDLSATEIETIDTEKLDDLPSNLDFEGAPFVFLAGDSFNSASLVED